MSDPSALQQSVIDVIIPHSTTSQVVLLAESGSWSLPQVLIGSIWETDLSQICYALRQTLGITTTILRCIAQRRDATTHQEYLTYVLENRDPSWQPPAEGRWASRAELDLLTDPEQHAVLDSYLTEVESGAIPELRMPWYRVGWLDEAVAWIEAQLVTLGTPLVGPVEQVKHWSISSILRAHTATGAVYFKVAAALPLFANEPVVLSSLAQRFPDFIPAPMCLDPERRWMLVDDFGKPVGRNGPLAARQEMLRIFGSIQRDCVAVVDELLRLGCLDRRLERLRTQAAVLATDEVTLRGLTDEEIAQFQAALPRLEAMCDVLTDCGVPQTLVHGDLHLDNMAIKGEQYYFFDWTDACVTHPFFDLISVYDDKDSIVQAQLREVYLATWRDYAPMEQLLQAWALAEPLSDLHQAVSYQHILRGLEVSAQDDFSSAVPFYVRRILKAVQTGAFDDIPVVGSSS